MILTIDPAVHMCALAMFGDDHTLTWCAYVPSGKRPVLPRVDIAEVVLERPKVYPKAKSVDPNDLIRVAQAGGWMAGACAPQAILTEVEPATWKGQIPKAVHSARMQKVLSPAEMRAIIIGSQYVADSLQHNIWDAVGLGLWRTRRMFRVQ